ncbi:MAG: aminotransferase class I/II-fold pyridoxal phosphate-dependent enzyme [Paracoccaceae bacterium]
MAIATARAPAGLARLRSRADELFDYLDLDGSGKVTIDELQQVMTVWGEPLSTAEIDALIAALDRDGDRAVDADEFRSLFEGTRDAAGVPDAFRAASRKVFSVLMDEIAQADEQLSETAAGGAWMRINPALWRMEYAVRGEVERQAARLGGRLAAGESLGFDELIMCNIGNPQAVGQPPLSFMRQVLALCDCPELLASPEIGRLLPEDAIARARQLLAAVPGGTGAYSHSQGLPAVREAVARFISARDRVPADAGDVFLTSGASGGIAAILQLLITSPADAVLTPVPHYPFYSATCRSLAARAVGYFLDEAESWEAKREALSDALCRAHAEGLKPKALVIINPGNPTGQVFSAETLEMILGFCAEHGLWLLADEVYQENVYTEAKRFVSAREALHRLGLARKLPLVSFHSVSKGMIGECGRRGGYMEVSWLHPAVRARRRRKAARPIFTIASRSSSAPAFARSPARASARRPGAFTCA